MRRWLSPIALCAALAAGYGPAFAAGVDIIKAPLVAGSPFVTQPIGAKNTSGRQVDWVSVECGFFRAGALVATGMNNSTHIAPGQTAFFDVVAKTPAADTTECRVSRLDYE